MTKIVILPLFFIKWKLHLINFKNTIKDIKNVTSSMDPFLKLVKSEIGYLMIL